MFCATCGTELGEGALLCPKCGRVLSSEEVMKSKAANGQLSKKEFYKLPGMKAYRGNILTCAVILYICAGVTILAAFLLDELSASILDGIFLVAMGLWLQLGKSRICAIITTCYGLMSVGLVLVASGKVQGWWIPLAGIWAIIYTFKYQKMWKQYQEKGILPAEAISEK